MLHGTAFLHQATIKQIEDYIINQQARSKHVQEEKEHNDKK